MRCLNCEREYEDPNDECLKPPEEGMTVADDGPWFHTPAVEGTCIHCGRRVPNEADGWADPKAGHDVEDGDGIWRYTCDKHDTFRAEHEVEEPDGADRTQEQTTAPRDSENVDMWDPLGGAKR